MIERLVAGAPSAAAAAPKSAKKPAAEAKVPKTPRAAKAAAAAAPPPATKVAAVTPAAKRRAALLAAAATPLPASPPATRVSVGKVTPRQRAGRSPAAARGGRAGGKPSLLRILLAAAALAALSAVAIPLCQQKGCVAALQRCPLYPSSVQIEVPAAVAEPLQRLWASPARVSASQAVAGALSGGAALYGRACAAADGTAAAARDRAISALEYLRVQAHALVDQASAALGALRPEGGDAAAGGCAGPVDPEALVAAIMPSEESWDNLRASVAAALTPSDATNKVAGDSVGGRVPARSCKLFVRWSGRHVARSAGGRRRALPVRVPPANAAKS